jgi:cell division protein FtsI (penicillin-binding protein 3)
VSSSERRDPAGAPIDSSTAFRPIIALSLFGVVALALLALGARLCWINAVQRGELLAWSQQQHVGQIPWPARRGFILDRRGRILAGTRERHSLFCDPHLVDDFVPIALKLSAILGEAPGAIHQKLDERSESRFVWLGRHLDDAQADAIRALDCPGLGLVSESERQYPNGHLAGHVLGFVGRDGHGLEGIEAYYEDSLAGVDGRRVVLKDASRNTLAVLADGSAPPQNGRHIVLTIDSVIQSNLEQALAEGVAQREAESGVGVVMNPRTGEILAMACVPGFDPKNFSVVPPELRRNRVITDPVEPGSIFKPYVGCMALAEKVVRINEPIFCHNGLFVTGSRRIHDVHPAGTIPFRDVIVKSSNIGMAIVGDRLGKERMERYLRAFGYGAPTGLGFPGESEGMLPPLSQWSGYSAMSMSFGRSWRPPRFSS